MVRTDGRGLEKKLKRCLEAENILILKLSKMEYLYESMTIFLSQNYVKSITKASYARPTNGVFVVLSMHNYI